MASKDSTKTGEKTKAMTIATQFPTPRERGLDWHCSDHPSPETFHPTDADGLAEAQNVCAPCPMRSVCLSLGLDRGEWGVWGGVLLEGGKPLAAPRKPGRPSKKSLQAAEAAQADLQRTVAAA